MSRRLLLSLLALVVPPLAVYRTTPDRRLRVVVLVVWLIGLAVFFGLMAGPGLLVVLAASVTALWTIWTR